MQQTLKTCALSIVKCTLAHNYSAPEILVCCIPDTDTWVTLPTPTRQHGIVSHNGKLTLVGGILKDSWPIGGITSEIHVWNSDKKRWTEPYPSTPMQWKGVSCASYLHYLIVAGGITYKINGVELTSTDSVQILDTKSI